MSHTYETASTPEEVVRIFTGLLNAGDLDGLMTMYADDATFSPELGVLARGKDEIRAVLEPMTSPPPSVVASVTWVQQAGDHALIINDHTITVEGPDGAPMKIQGRSTDVVKRGDDGAWRFFLDCVWAGTMNPPGA